MGCLHAWCLILVTRTYLSPLAEYSIMVRNSITFTVSGEPIHKFHIVNTLSRNNLVNFRSVPHLETKMVF